MTLTTETILKYSPIKKINIDDFNNTLRDKNYTIICSFSGQESVDNPDIVARSPMVTDNKLTHTGDYFFNNLDSTVWDNTTNDIYPLFSFGNNVHYNGQSPTIDNLTNCHTLFINNGTIHYIINDDSTIPLVHLQHPITNVVTKPWNHCIVTRNDTIFSMHLIQDHYAIFNPLLDGKNIDIVENSVLITKDAIIAVNTVNVSNFKLKRTDAIITSNNKRYKYIVKFLVDVTKNYILMSDINAMYTLEITAYTGGAYSPYSGRHTILNMPLIYSTYNELFTAQDPINNLYNLNITISILFDYQPTLEYFNFAMVPIEYNINTLIDSIYDNNLVIYKHTVKSWNVICSVADTDINFDNFINNGLNIGYIERIPTNLLVSNKLYKDSFSGNISECNIWYDKAFLRKFETKVDRSALHYHNVDGTNIITNSPNIPDINIINNDINTSIYYNSNTTESKFTQRDFAAYSYIENINDMYINDITEYGYDYIKADNLYNANNLVDNYVPKILTLNDIDNILPMVELHSENIEYLKNTLPRNTNVVILKFNFELYLHDTTTNSLNYKKNDYCYSIANGIVEYDTTLSYADLCGTDYINVNNFESYKQLIISSLNAHIKLLSASGYKLNKFYVTFIRDERYSMSYDVDINIPHIHNDYGITLYYIPIKKLIYKYDRWLCTDVYFDKISHANTILDDSFVKYKNFKIINGYLTTDTLPIYYSSNAYILPLVEKDEVININDTYELFTLTSTLAEGEIVGVPAPHTTIVNFILNDATIYSNVLSNLEFNNLEFMRLVDGCTITFMWKNKEYIITEINNELNMSYKLIDNLTIHSTDNTSILIDIDGIDCDKNLLVIFGSISNTSITYNYISTIAKNFSVYNTPIIIYDYDIINLYYEHINTTLFTHIGNYNTNNFYYGNNYSDNVIVDNNFMNITNNNINTLPPYTGISELYTTKYYNYNFYKNKHLYKNGQYMTIKSW